MTLLYKSDWDQAQEHYCAWWAHEAFERCALWVTAPLQKSSGSPPPPAPEDPLQRWTDLEYIFASIEYGFSHSFYGGEAFPLCYPGYPGHTAIPVFLGCPIHLDSTTGWWDPILLEEDLDLTKLTLDRHGKWWRFSVRLLHGMVEYFRGKSIPSTGAIGGSGDTLGALRSTERLLYDLVDRPAQVIEAEKVLMDIWMEVYDVCYSIIHETTGGSAGWFPLWAPGKFYAAQNDFSYMISPETFRKVFLPQIERQTQFLDYSVYHVDGPGAFVHVRALCELPRLQALQILPGAGKPSPLHYLETLKQVQRAGKNLHITIPCQEVETALSELSARGLFIATSCPTEDQARDLLHKALTWSKDRKV